MNRLIFISTILLLASCGQIMTEAESRKNNEKGLKELNEGIFAKQEFLLKKLLKVQIFQQKREHKFIETLLKPLVKKRNKTHLFIIHNMQLIAMKETLMSI